MRPANEHRKAAGAPFDSVPTTGNTMTFSLCKNGSYLLREIRQRKRMSAIRDGENF